MNVDRFFGSVEIRALKLKKCLGAVRLEQGFGWYLVLHIRPWWKTAHGRTAALNCP